MIDFKSKKVWLLILAVLFLVLLIYLLLILGPRCYESWPERHKYFMKRHFESVLDRGFRKQMEYVEEYGSLKDFSLSGEEIYSAQAYRTYPVTFVLLEEKILLLYTSRHGILVVMLTEQIGERWERRCIAFPHGTFSGECKQILGVRRKFWERNDERKSAPNDAPEWCRGRAPLHE